MLWVNNLSKQQASLPLNLCHCFLFKAGGKNRLGAEMFLCGNTTVELHLISWSKLPLLRHCAFNDHPPSNVSDVQLDCLPHTAADKAAIL